MEDVFQDSLRKLDELIRHLRSCQSSDCESAEQEDALLVRLADLKSDLRPEDRKNIEAIDALYRRYIDNIAG